MAAIARPQRKISPELEKSTNLLNQELVNFIAIYPKLKNLSNFSQLVLFEASKIPTGEVISYAELAGRINRPKACRAVGNALSKNPYIGQIPCHRIIKSDNHIGGFGAELDLKLFLLNREDIFFDKNGYRI